MDVVRVVAFRVEQAGAAAPEQRLVRATARLFASRLSLHLPIRYQMWLGMCTMWPAPGISAASRSACGAARSGLSDASTVWM